jgi:Uma2 family endonuclease
LREYVLVSQGEAAVEIYRKEGDRWIYQLLTGAGAELRLESVDCTVPLSEIYRNVTFTAEMPA